MISTTPPPPSYFSAKCTMEMTLINQFTFSNRIFSLLSWTEKKEYKFMKKEGSDRAGRSVRFLWNAEWDPLAFLKCWFFKVKTITKLLTFTSLRSILFIRIRHFISFSISSASLCQMSWKRFQIYYRNVPTMLRIYINQRTQPFVFIPFHF